MLMPRDTAERIASPDILHALSQKLASKFQLHPAFLDLHTYEPGPWKEDKKQLNPLSEHVGDPDERRHSRRPYLAFVPCKIHEVVLWISMIFQLCNVGVDRSNGKYHVQYR